MPCKVTTVEVVRPSCSADLKVHLEPSKCDECECESSNGNDGQWHYASSDSESECECDCDCKSCREGDEWWGASCDLADRFASHDAECYYCDKKPIVGVRWVYKLNEDYSACSDCVPDKKYWRLHRFSWDNPVPEASLSEKDTAYSDQTAHLQKVLTELGYMKLEHTDKYTGYFQNRTGDAVEKFRKACGIFNGNMRVYDKRTQHVLEQVFCDCDC